MNILLIGCGKMGGALLSRWVEGSDRFTIVDPGLGEAPNGVQLVTDRAALGDEMFDVAVVAIKPQMIDQVLPDYVAHIADDGYALSIAAGCSIDRLMRVLGGKPVIRVMPNLPAAIGEGVSGLVAGSGVTPAQQDHARALMALAGTVVVVDDEDKLDRVTAVAGSGPGYVFEIARAYVAAAVDLGFTLDEARALALGTMAGGVAMARKSDQSLEELRNSVTSKHGTTEAGLQALNGDDLLSRRLRDTVGTAYARAVELR
ncbi:pyrroline-5-carboxylate reductase family protein [Sphingomonas oligophenolica]|uniref:Pyrroline-5-carboxylate reductase n=1 Tax=Sphingomonas oligophenolica TaxID=301154 RepID=A0A502CM66_9SPHN|nr:pyrroline-5-carboxylate reductase [Sphingomonas oligophenolica]TPG14287.1 pyrroline-5-carboxylate reductase [Sphingomonas oligophenolica]